MHYDYTGCTYRQRPVRMTKRVLLGDQAEIYLEVLSSLDYKNPNEQIVGGVFETWFRDNSTTWCAFDSSGGEVFVEEFKDLVEATKYACGIQAETIGGQFI